MATISSNLENVAPNLLPNAVAKNAAGNKATPEPSTTEIVAIKTTVPKPEVTDAEATPEVEMESNEIEMEDEEEIITCWWGENEAEEAKTDETFGLQSLEVENPFQEEQESQEAAEMWKSFNYPENVQPITKISGSKKLFGVVDNLLSIAKADSDAVEQYNAFTMSADAIEKQLTSDISTMYKQLQMNVLQSGAREVFAGMNVFIRDVIQKAISVTEYRDQTTVSVGDVLHVLRVIGKPLYWESSFGLMGENNDEEESEEGGMEWEANKDEEDVDVYSLDKAVFKTFVNVMNGSESVTGFEEEAYLVIQTAAEKQLGDVVTRSARCADFSRSPAVTAEHVRFASQITQPW